jgi:hypothetical protein
MALGEAARAQPAVPNPPQLRVLVANRGAARPEVLAAAERVAGAIYAAAGVEVRWLNGGPHPLAGDEFDLTVAIVSGEGPQALARTAETLGLAASDSAGDGQRGRMAWVFFDRVEDRASAHHLPIYRVCGEVIAHELGHLLLPAGHSERGLMRPVLDLRYNTVEHFSDRETGLIQARAMSIGRGR